MITSNISLKKFNSWLVGGIAEHFALPTNKNQLLEALRFAETQQLKINILGGGSNVLISDDGVKGLTLCLQKFSGHTVSEVDGKLVIHCQSGVSKSELLKIFLKYKLAPALFLAGIPGDVGGGVVMNAGVAEAFVPREFTEIVEQITVMDPSGLERIFKKDQLEWSYRKCKGWEPGIISEVVISWPLEPDPSILEKVRAANKTRLSKQPLDLPSCGSVFKNPEGHKAAQLIDLCGLKGYSIGDAQVSTKHANFIVNTGDAKASDIWSVIQHVKETVYKKTSVELSTEVRLLGDWDSVTS